MIYDGLALSLLMLYGIRLNSSQSRHPGRVTPYPGSQKALAFITIPDNAPWRFRDDLAKSSTGLILLHLVPTLHDEIGSHPLAIVLERNPLNRHEFLKLCQPGDKMPDIAIAAPQDNFEESRY